MKRKKPISIIIIEDNPHYAKTLNRMLESSNNIKSTKVFCDVEECRDSFPEIKDETDIVLLDLHLPGENGITFIPELLKTLEKAQIIILTQDNDYVKTLRAIQLGVSGYLLKKSSIAEIQQAIDDVMKGGCVIEPGLCKFVLESIGAKNENSNLSLSPRELEILELLAIGLAKKEIAEQLSLSYGRVAQGTDRIFRKLKVSNVAAAVAKGIRKGII